MESANSDAMGKAFDLNEKAFKGQEREKVIQDLLENYVVPFLMLISTGVGIKKAVKKYKTLKNRIDVKTREALSI